MAKKINQDRLESIWKAYKDGKAYQKSIGMETMIPMCVDFYEGRQWGKVSEDAKTKNLPRPTFNQIEMIVNSKTSGIYSTPLKIIFNSNDMPELANKLTAFNSHIEKEMKLDDICEEMIDQAAVERSSFIHVFWDADACGKRGEFKGGVRAEMLEPLNVIVHNPRETDIQKQKWIIIVSRCELDAVKEMCSNEAQRKLVEPDNNENLKNGEKEQDGSELVTVLTRYFKNNGEVYFEKVTKNVVLCEPTALNPDINKSYIKEDAASADVPEDVKGKENEKHLVEYKAGLYPVEVYQYKAKKNCIYGRGEVEPIIPNNRTINFNTAMMAKSIEDQGFGTIVAKEGAMVKGDKITNNPTKLLIDRYKGGQGFYALQKQPFNPQTYQLNKDILETTRSVTGATEVMTGEIMGANQSGASIAYLQQQAQKPLDKLAKRYRKFRQRLAEILLQFYVLFYEDKEFDNEMDAKAATEELREQIANQGGDPSQVPEIKDAVKYKDMFVGSEYRGYDFDITIEVGAGTQYSEIVTVNILDNLLNGGKISLKTYYKIYPDTLLPNKKELLQDLEEQEQGQIAHLTQLAEQQQVELQKQAKSAEKMMEVVNNILPTIQENKRLNAALAELRAEYTGKINEANRLIMEKHQDATDLAALFKLDQLDKMQGGTQGATSMSNMQNSTNQEDVNKV